jgi:hypothetical protein
MTHEEFISAYTRGKIKVEVDPAGASRFLSARLLLPWAAMPVAGIGVGIALSGWLYTGLAVIALAYLAPRLIKRSAPHFVFQQALTDPKVYYAATRADVLRIVPLKDEGGRMKDDPPLRG